MSGPAVLASALLAGLLALTGCSASSVESHGTTGTRLPDVTLQPVGSGRPVDLATLRRPTVVNLWASWCTPCRKELPQYQAFSKEYAGRVDVLGVDYQETRQSAALALARKTGVTYPLVADPDGKLHAIALPKLILVDAHGKVVFSKYLRITSLAQLEKLVQQHLLKVAA